MRPVLFLPVLLVAATGCLHEPLEAAWIDPTPPPVPETVVVREIAVGPGGEAPALPASPKDRPAPDPVPFRIGAGHGALGHVDLTECEAAGLTPGYLKLRVTFHPSGRVVHAAVEGPTAPPDEALECVGEALEAAVVPRFDGREATLSKSLFVEPRPEPAEEPGIWVRRHGAPKADPDGAKPGPVALEHR